MLKRLINGIVTRSHRKEIDNLIGFLACREPAQLDAVLAHAVWIRGILEIGPQPHPFPSDLVNRERAPTPQDRLSLRLYCVMLSRQYQHFNRDPNDKLLAVGTHIWKLTLRGFENEVLRERVVGMWRVLLGRPEERISKAHDFVEQLRRDAIYDDRPESESTPDCQRGRYATIRMKPVAQAIPRAFLTFDPTHCNV